MNKAHAINLLGGTPKKAAVAMGYRAVQTIYQWPDQLPQATADRVRGVVDRISKEKKRRGTARSAAPTKEVSHG